MILQKLTYIKAQIYFFGDNAQGKTNILEAIFISSLGKSFRTNKDKELIKENEENSKIEIIFVKDTRKEKMVLVIYILLLKN